MQDRQIMQTTHMGQRAYAPMHGGEDSTYHRQLDAIDVDVEARHLLQPTARGHKGNLRGKLYGGGDLRVRVVRKGRIF